MVKKVEEKPSIVLFNSMTKKKEEFKPLIKGVVNMYSCGPTVYHYAHIGNLRAYLTADLLKRMFIFNNFKVNHVMNITDVGHLTSDADEGEDKMEKGAKREGKTVWEVADYYTQAFFKDMENMNMLKPTYTKATEHVQEMIDYIKMIEQNGFTYVSQGNVYFDTSKLEDYQKLIGGRLDDDKKKARVDDDEHKKNQTDFVLWFTRHKYGDHAMVWDSPWGKGFPGWHIECSAMSNKYLGLKFDVHTGAVDLMNIHHSNEIAQCQGAHKHDPVNYWVHNEFLVMSEGKMSKSTGEFLRLQDLLAKGYSSSDYNYLLLGSHYRKKMLFSFDVLDSAKNAMNKLKSKYLEFKKNNDSIDEKIVEKYSEEFLRVINDDLNTPKALAVLWDVVNTDASNSSKIFLLDKFDEVLGLGLKELKEETVKIPREVMELMSKRQEARQQKRWKESDEIRAKIEGHGFRVIDSKDGSSLEKG